MIIEDYKTLRMPANLGTIRIRKYKKKIRLTKDGEVDVRSLYVDWKATRDLWEKEYPGKTMKELKLIKDKPMMYHTNEHTEQYVFRLFWNRSGCAIENKNIYSIVLTRTNKRRIAELVKSNPNTNYYE